METNSTKLVHYWIVKNFSYYLEGSFLEKRRFIESHPFSSATLNGPKSKFNLLLYPCGYDEDRHNGYMSLFLRLVSCDKPGSILIDYKFSIFNSEMKHYIMRKIENRKFNIGNRSSIRGLPKFIEHDYLLDPLYDFLSDDTLVVCCEIRKSGNVQSQLSPLYSWSCTDVKSSELIWSIDKFVTKSCTICNFLCGGKWVIPKQILTSPKLKLTVKKAFNLDTFGVNFQIVLFPEGHYDQFSDHISLMVNPTFRDDNYDPSTVFLCTISILDSRKRKVNQVYLKLTLGSFAFSNCVYKYIPRRELINRKDELLHEGKLVLVFEVEQFDNVETCGGDGKIEYNYSF